ncbi:energy transducer TonB [Polymorphobacter multimanifer]|nr:energy transducer TonB [Polymorphobacter multimanifer]
MSKNRMMAFGAVALLHVFLGYAFITGLALKAVKAIVQPLETVNVKEEAPPPDEPPPPPPVELEIPPFVPPPEVTIQSDSPPPVTIQTQSTVQQVAPPVFAPPAPPAPPAPAPTVAPTRATDRGRGNTIGEDDYPDASLRAGEEGVTRVRFVVGTDGKVGSCEVVASSGSARLDDATCKIIIRRFRYNPATSNGAPVTETKTVPIRWQIRDRR